MNVIAERYSLYCGDCIDVMRSFAPDSFDTLVSDPPAGVAFMGKVWDNHTRYEARTDKGQRTLDALALLDLEPWAAGFVAFTVDWAVEALRCLKPGAMGLVWALPRTSDLTGLGLRLAGFEVRDNVYHLFGSGFPKSHDISAAIDKAAGHIGHSTQTIKREIRSRYERRGMTLHQFNDACGFEASGYLRESSTWAGVLPSRDKWQKIKTVLDCDGDLDALFDEAEREIIGLSPWQNSANHFVPGANHKERVQLDITAPATDAARLWQGWGTSLKPAVEEWLLIMKPLDGTYAVNALQHGVAGLWVDGCRIEGEFKSGWSDAPGRKSKGGILNITDEIRDAKPDNPAGRFPANLILDQQAAALLDQMSGERPSGGGNKRRNGTVFDGGWKPMDWHDEADTGGASRYFTVLPDSEPRFFYCAKSSTAERNEGLDGLPEQDKQFQGAAKGLCVKCGRQRVNVSGQCVCDDPEWVQKTHSMRNPHPTVKPLELMRWLVRLTKTPTGGSVLDPFAGSGTTGVACLLEGRKAVLIEREAEYHSICRHRLEHWQDEADVKPRKIRGKDKDFDDMPLFAEVVDIGG